MDVFFSHEPDVTVQPLTLANCPADKRLWVVRGELIHPQVAGNKWFKLKYNMLLAQQRGGIPVLSFGGPWSNHIHALAAAGRQSGITTIGVIRGSWRKQLTPMLADASRWGMRLVFVNKQSYRLKANQQWLVSQLPGWLQQAIPDVAERIIGTLPGAFTSAAPDTARNVENSPTLFARGILVIPEGGSDIAGIKGVGEWAKSIYSAFAEPATIFLPVGSGGTLAGFVSVDSDHRLVGVPVLKTESHLSQQILKLLNDASSTDRRRQTQWQLTDERYAWGGYARYPKELRRYVEQTENATDIPYDPVYTAKAVYALQDRLQGGDITTTDVVLVHTGGLQGRRGMIESEA